MDQSSECIFCKIANGTISTNILFDGGDTLFFNDIHPQAPVHIIGIPKAHIVSLDAMVGNDHMMIGKLLHDATHVARDLGILDSGYRIVTNIGLHAGQEVPHLHFHILGGEPLGPIRCKV